MFNIGSFEVLLICVIALLVLGPERLPGAIRTAGLWIGRFRRSFYKVKSEIERELNADEIRRQLHNENIMAELEAAKDTVEETARDTQASVNKIVSSDNFDPGASQYTEGQKAASDSESQAYSQKHWLKKSNRWARRSNRQDRRSRTAFTVWAKTPNWLAQTRRRILIRVAPENQTRLHHEFS